MNNQAQDNKKICSHSEKGRSLVEMLAVIVIIGVITVGGAELIGYALNYTKANAIVSEAKTQLSALDRRDIRQGTNKAEYVLKGFAGADGKVYIYNVYPVELDRQPANDIVLKILGVSQDVCKILKYRTDSAMMINGKPQESATCKEEDNIVQFKLISPNNTRNLDTNN